MVNVGTIILLAVTTAIFVGLTLFVRFWKTSEVPQVQADSRANAGPKDQKRQCPVTTDVNKLVACTSDLDCVSCDGRAVCREVDNTSPDANKHYRWKLGTTDPVDIPDGKWCLPAKPAVDTFPCNPLSGFPVLTDTGTERAWTCHCRYPNLLQGRGLYGDCTYEVACGKQEGLGRLVCPDGASFCTKKCDADGNVSVAGTYSCPWTSDPSWDPRDGVCRCNAQVDPVTKQTINYTPIYPGATGGVGVNRSTEKYCVSDSCTPGHFDPASSSCKCTSELDAILRKTGKTAKSELKLADFEDGSAIYSKEHGFKTFRYQNNHNGVPVACIPDQCNPGGFDISDDGADGKVTCNCLWGGTQLLDATYSDRKSYLPGFVCGGPCEAARATAKPKEGTGANLGDPTCGTRGTCVNVSDGKGGAVAQCTDCRMPYVQDSAKLCNTRKGLEGDSCGGDSDCYGDSGSGGTCSQFCNFPDTWNCSKKCESAWQAKDRNRVADKSAPCSSNGTIFRHLEGKCKCFPGYNGDNCQYSDKETCNGNGTANPDGTCTCNPNPKSGVYIDEEYCIEGIL